MIQTNFVFTLSNVKLEASCCSLTNYGHVGILVSLTSVVESKATYYWEQRSFQASNGTTNTTAFWSSKRGSVTLNKSLQHHNNYSKYITST